MKKNLLISICLLFITSTLLSNDNKSCDYFFQKGLTSLRVISLSGFLSEVIHELGHSDMIIGRDVTSTYPEKIQSVPNLGHVSQLNVEAVLALEPDLIFVEESQLNRSKVFPQLKAAGIKIVAVPTQPNFDNPIQAAAIIAKTLDSSTEKIQALKNQIKEDKTLLSNTLSSYDTNPKVLFIYARGAGRLMVSGVDTPMSAMIEHAGGKNAIQSFDGFKALTPEALIEAEPDVILMFKSGLESLDGKAGLEQIKGIAQTPAFKNDRIVAMDGHDLSAFGFKSVQVAIELAKAIH